MTREHLVSTMPDLPTSVSACHGGYYRPISLDTHMYEELPCLGVLSEAVRHAVNNESIGPYASSLAAEGVPHQNLLEYRPLGNRRNEAKNLTFDANITPENFPEYLLNSGINIPFLNDISAILAQSKTFRVTTIGLNNLPESTWVCYTGSSTTTRTTVLPGLEN